MWREIGEDGNSGSAQRGWLIEHHTWKEWEQEQEAQAGDGEAKAEAVVARPHGPATARGGAGLWV